MRKYVTELLLAALLVAAGLPALARADDKPTADPALSKSEQRIGRLIEQLGADDFGLRERAQGELSQLGLEAYDALHAAQSHHDPEIALRARYLLRSMSVRWFAESDSPKVVAILKEYGDLPEEQKRNRIDRLAALESSLGVQPLVRLADSDLRGLRRGDDSLFFVETCVSNFAECRLVDLLGATEHGPSLSQRRIARPPGLIEVRSTDRG